MHARTTTVQCSDDCYHTFYRVKLKSKNKKKIGGIIGYDRPDQTKRQLFIFSKTFSFSVFQVKKKLDDRTPLGVAMISFRVYSKTVQYLYICYNTRTTAQYVSGSYI